MVSFNSCESGDMYQTVGSRVVKKKDFKKMNAGTSNVTGEVEVKSVKSTKTNQSSKS